MGVNLSVAAAAGPSSISLNMSLPSPRSLLIAFARESILRVLEDGVKVGAICIYDKHGLHSINHDSKAKNGVTFRVHDENFWLRVALSADLGFAEAYMAGEVDVDDLKSVMDLWLDNQSAMESGLSHFASSILSGASGFANHFLGQTRSQARLNAVSSYDTSNTHFQNMLSSEMMYSCALWDEPEGGPRGDLMYSRHNAATDIDNGELEAAQLRKLHLVLKRARVRPGDRILEFGSGWGALAILAATQYGCTVDSLTLSAEQKALAERRAAEAGVSHRITFHLMDYRDIPTSWEKSFDAFVSLEMLEHVGAAHYACYFRLVDFALKSSRATAVVSSSTFPESRFSAYQPEDFMRRYMWPNSCLPSPSALISACNSSTGAGGRLSLESVENHAAHYPRTLREWGRRLDARCSSADIPELQGDEKAYEAFRRKWVYLFAYAGAGFAKGYISCHMLTFTRENDCPAVPCD